MKKRTRILYLGNMLAQKGFTPTAIEHLGPLLEAEGYTITYASDKRNKVARLMDMATTILKLRNEIDIVLIDTYSTKAFYFAWTAAFICRKIGKPYIPVLHGGNLPERFDNSPMLVNRLFGNSFMNVAVSPYLQGEMLKRNYPVKLIPNSIDITHYPFKERASLKPNLLWVRSFHELYNPAMALEVLYRLKARYPAATITMVGPDKDGSLQMCKDLATQLNIADSVVFTGRLTQSQWIELSANCDFFLNTSTVDNMPFSIVEALALGLIVVSTDVGGIPYLINTSNGILVGNKYIDGMVTAIQNTLEKD